MSGGSYTPIDNLRAALRTYNDERNHFRKRAASFDAIIEVLEKQIAEMEQPPTAEPNGK